MLAVVLTIQVLSLFQAKEVILRPGNGARLIVRSSGEARTLAIGEAVTFRRPIAASDVSSTGPITVVIPGKMVRTYPGSVSVSAELKITTKVDLETAVSWAVNAESSPGANVEARKAVAVAARSWFLASQGRHGEADACDTTHCQFLGAPGRMSPEVTGTTGLVLLFDGKPVEAMHSADCGGVTHTLEEVGLNSTGYPFYSVQCPAPSVRWTRTLQARDAALIHRRPHDENVRIEIVRRSGWGAIPSDNYRIEGNRLEGSGRGHGVGLCQLGAKTMAERGMDFMAILRHYFPNTLISTLP